MSKFKITTTEKIIGSIQMLLGIFIICSTIYALNVSINITLKIGIAWEDISFLRIFKKYHSILLISILIIISGYMLFRSYSNGWILSVISWLTLGFEISIINWKFYQKENIFWSNYDVAISCFFAFLFWSIAYILITKNFKLKYNPNRKTWIIIIITTMILIIDKILSS